MNLLLINSNADSAFVAFYNEKELVVSYSSEFVNDSNKHQSDTLIQCLHAVHSKTQDKTVDAVSVIIGPGAFTGVRVGLSIAKGAAMALDKKIIPINNFELELNKMASIGNDKNYCVLIPAKLPEYYYSLGKNASGTEQSCVLIEDIVDKFSNDTVIVGNFSDETQLKLNYFETINTRELKPELDSMIELTVKKFNEGSLFNGSEVDALYIKDFAIKK